MQIGEPKRTIIVEPLEDPVPREEPQSERDADPERRTPSEPEKTPA